MPCSRDPSGLRSGAESEFGRTGVYILTGYSEGDDDLPTVYVGQADGVKGRIDSHAQQKDFWDTGIVFVSNGGGGLNRAHVSWLEYALVARSLSGIGSLEARINNLRAIPGL